MKKYTLTENGGSPAFSGQTGGHPCDASKTPDKPDDEDAQ